MNLIILFPDDAVAKDCYQLDDHRAEHVRSVLKSEVGDSLKVGLLNGPIGTAKVIQIDESIVKLQCDELVEQPPPVPTVDLIVALPRPQTLKKVLIVSATMGVRQIHLIRANRVEKSFFHSPLLEPENYTRFLIEGMSQGSLTRLPEVTIHDRFRLFVEECVPHLHIENGGATSLLLANLEAESGILQLVKPNHKHIVIAIGPEGGWVPFETEMMHTAGFESFSLGRFVLRVEQAVTAALSQLELTPLAE